jgi:membrane-bound lytic murein transglycosylase D
MKPAEAARSVGMDEDQLREINRIPARMVIKGGSTLLVPRGNSLLANVSGTIADNAQISLVPDAPPLRRVSIKAGKRDSVASIAKRYRVSAAQVAEWNDVAPGASFARGRTIVVYVQPSTGKRTARAAHVATRPASAKTGGVAKSRSGDKRAAAKKGARQQATAKPSSKQPVRLAHQ